MVGDHERQAKNASPLDVAAVQDSGGDAAAFLATYLLPVLAAPSPSTTDVIGYAIYVLVLYIIFVRSELAQVNPTLYLLGRRVVLVTTTHDEHYHLICKHAPRPNECIEVVRLNELRVRKGEP